MPESVTPAAPLRSFGRFELRALLSKSTRSMIWLVRDPRAGMDLILCMPRAAPNSPAAMAHWMSMAEAGARIEHPKLARMFEIGQVDQWPYVAYDRALGETLDERLARSTPPTPLEAADWIGQFLEGLAFAHEAGHAHRDIQPANLLIDAQNKVRLIGLEVAQEVFPAHVDFNTVSRRAVRESAEEDVLCAGLLLHRVLSGKPPLEEMDLQAVVQQMQPLGKEMVRLGWETPFPIPDPLRAICNRATDRQARQRYHSARAFLRALEGWRVVAQHAEGGPIQLLLDKLQRTGHLPTTTPRLQQSLAAGSGFDAQHASQISELVLRDMALTLELLRRVNNALRMNGHAGETVLNMQRAVQMLGLDGVQAAATALKPWPGLLQGAAAESLRQVMRRVTQAGQIAQRLRPAGYDAEVVYLVTLLQNLGRLLLSYHFPDDAQQIRHLMQAPEPTEDNPQPLGMSEQAAAYAVLGCDLDALGTALARYWNLGDEVVHMARRVAVDSPVHPPQDDAETLRQTASLANELMEALSLPEARRRAGIELVTRRYAKALGLGLREVMEALNPGAAAPTSAATGAAAAAGAAGAAAPAEGSLRQRLSAKHHG